MNTEYPIGYLVLKSITLVARLTRYLPLCDGVGQLPSNTLKAVLQ